MIKFLVVKTPTKDQYRTEYLCGAFNWSTHEHHASRFTWDEAVAMRDDLRKEPGLTPLGRDCIVILSASE